ncbi:hypothetical protein KQ247_14835 [Ruegeria pomeroyi]|nr:hypothetical protein [Ruegeria pomeroyi]NVK96705.1 hypothetical protein [Ruegeria pomeroyi]NVL01437.1 hypothetical protein [Ruegeria pomeroyi]QWV08092.1 hypothetical protein KQ247_14835 [Ruegeria pomeroyi]
MWIIAILCIGTLLVWYSNKRRGQRFVRAVHFLDLLDSGANTDEANGKVARLFTKHSTSETDVAAIEYAMDKANRMTDGKQLLWIDEARQRGFAIDSGDTRFDMAHLSQAQAQTNRPQDFAADFSEGQSTTAPGGSFPHAPSGLADAYHAGLEKIEANKDALRSALQAIIFTGARWGVRGAMAGFVFGLIVPRLGVLSYYEIWAVPIVVAFFAAMAGVALGSVYGLLRWVFTG